MINCFGFLAVFLLSSVIQAIPNRQPNRNIHQAYGYYPGGWGYGYYPYSPYGYAYPSPGGWGYPGFPAYGPFYRSGPSRVLGVASQGNPAETTIRQTTATSQATSGEGVNAANQVPSGPQTPPDDQPAAPESGEAPPESSEAPPESNGAPPQAQAARRWLGKENTETSSPLRTRTSLDAIASHLSKREELVSVEDFSAKFIKEAEALVHPAASQTTKAPNAKRNWALEAVE